MKNNLIRLVLICLLATGGAAAQPNGPAKYVVLIAIDGFRPDFYLQEKWPTPNLKALMRAGSYARGLRPVVPSTTIPDHVTMMTGALPARHGVHFNVVFDPANWKSDDYKEAAQIKLPTLWDAVKKAGGSVAAVRWVVSNHSPSIDYNFTRFGEYEAVTPKGLLNEIEQNVTGKLPTTIEKLDLDYYTTDLQNAGIAAYLLKKYKPTLLTARVRCTDYFQHEQGLNGDKVFKAIAVADVYVGQVIEATKAAGTYAETAFIIVGDHGFEERHTELAFNTLLINEGLLFNAPDRGDWKACFHDQFLLLRNKDDKPTLTRVRKLLENQPPNIRKLYRIVERAELDTYGTAPEVALAIQPIDGIGCTSRYEQPNLVQSANGGSHGAIPDRPGLYAGFIAQGAGVRSGLTIPLLGMEDVAPLIASLLGVSFSAPDGVLYPGLVTPKAK